MATPDKTNEKVVTMTERARNKALAVRAEEPDGDKLALFLEVTDPGGLEYSYDLYFDDVSSARPGDAVHEEEGLTLVVPKDSIEHVRGASLDLSKDLLNPGWVVNNPNSPSPAVGKSMPASELSGTIEERIEQMLSMVVNPSIASHGGSAEMVGFEEGTVYVKLSGGCQGCGMASVTLTQGIQVSLKEAIPEVERVVDVTDHASGTNPYYEPAKK